MFQMPQAMRSRGEGGGEMKENKLSRDYNVFYYPKKFLEDKLCHLLSVIELNKGDKAVSDALQEEISQYRKAISLLTPIPIERLFPFVRKWRDELAKGIGIISMGDIKRLLKEYEKMREEK